MNLEEIKAALKTWSQTISESESQIHALRKLLCSSAGSHLIRSVYCLQIEYTHATSVLVQDEDDWLKWFWLDRDLGRKENNMVTLGNGEDVRYVKTTDDLAQLIYDLANNQN